MKIIRLLSLTFLFSAFILSGSAQKEKASDLASVPEWSKHAIWYQIFVERFRNGDKSNDPTPADMAGSYPGSLPANWAITPWGHDWYSHEVWLDSVKADGFYSKIQARRYGGDLQGVLDKIDYLKSLGVTAIYFNPLDDSPSLHKYDAANYTHIDRNFGPDPAGDVAIMNEEVHNDPDSWKWTAADKLFLKVVSEFHKKGIKVIMDYSWNHTGKRPFSNWRQYHFLIGKRRVKQRYPAYVIGQQAGKSGDNGALSSADQVNLFNAAAFQQFRGGKHIQDFAAKVRLAEHDAVGGIKVVIIIWRKEVLVPEIASARRCFANASYVKSEQQRINAGIQSQSVFQFLVR